MYSWGRLCLSLSHCKKITFQLRFFKNWLSKSHCCVLSLFDASYKLTFKADLQEFPMYNARNSVLENKKGFQKGRATTASRFQPFAFWLLSLSHRVFFPPLNSPSLLPHLPDVLEGQAWGIYPVWTVSWAPGPTQGKRTAQKAPALAFVSHQQFRECPTKRDLSL